MTVTSHEIAQNTATKTLMQTWWQRYFHEGGFHALFPRKESVVVNSHENGILRVSIMVRGDA